MLEDIQAITSVVESLSLIGFMLLSLRYVDNLRLDERRKADDRTDDIVNDWKRMRRLDDTENL